VLAADSRPRLVLISPVCSVLLGSERDGAGYISLRSLTIADDNYVREDKKCRGHARK
jgi:hypothetical protein